MVPGSFTGIGAMKKLLKVEIGQHYQSVGAVTKAAAFTYRVDNLFRSKIDNVEYAQLVQIGDPSRRKSVASSALLNARQFIPVDNAFPVKPEAA